MDKYVTGIYRTEKQLKLLSSKPIAILSTGVSDKLAIAAASASQKEEPDDINYTWIAELKNTVKLRAAEQTSIRLKNMKILVVSEKQGLPYSEQNENLARQEQLLFAKEKM